jgi:hypothetical protein
MASAVCSPVASSQLESIRQELNVNSERAKQLFAGLSDAQLLEKPPSGGWSVAECVAHLNLATEEFYKRGSLELKDVPKSAGRLHADFVGKLLAWVLEPPYRIKTKTMPFATPTKIDASSVLPEFLAIQSKLQQKLNESEGQAIDKVKIASPFGEKISYNLYSFFLITTAHQRRHLWQAEQLRKTFK